MEIIIIKKISWKTQRSQWSWTCFLWPLISLYLQRCKGVFLLKRHRHNSVRVHAINLKIDILIKWTILVETHRFLDICWYVLCQTSSSPLEVFLQKGGLKMSSKFTGEHPCRIVNSIKLRATLLKSQFGIGFHL